MKTVMLPGLIDPHVHLRDPGATHKEDFETGMKAAVAGGFVFVLDMPNNPEPTITKEALEKKKQLVKEKAVCDVGFIFGAIPDNTSEFQKVINDVYGLKVYMDTTTGNLLIEEQKTLENIFDKWPSSKPIVVHAEGRTMNHAIDLAKKFNKKLHIAHLSQKSELIRVIEEKEKGLPITCEATPHHLFLTEKDAKRLGPYGLMKPPLRKQSDVDFLWKHIDAIDCIATDHAPHAREEKESEKPPFGVPGLETSVPLMLTAVHEGKIPIDEVIRLMHVGPRRIFGMHVSTDSYIEVDEDAEYTIENKNLFTKCGWSPFDGMKVKGRVIRTVIRGKEVYKYY
ncbi:MAG: amidohydrolase family protein [Candidatus Roizmanbacteria bacterium]|nr:amidohydrolase family protein [Candidatus Roizmanbacteria bacterium]